MCVDAAEWVYADDDGANLRTREWQRPVTVMPAVKRQAEVALVAAKAVLAPAARDLVKRWLATLGTLCAGQTTAVDARAKIAAYAGLLEHPASSFTRESLKAAAERFKWLPSYSELSAFLDE